MVSSCIGELFARIACFCIENDKEFARERHADDHFGFASLLQPFGESAQMRIVPGDVSGNDKENATRSGAAATNITMPLAFAAIVGDGGQAHQFGDGLVGNDPDLRHFRQQTGNGAVRQTLEEAERLVELGPQRVVVNQRSDLASQPLLLALEAGQHRGETGPVSVSVVALLRCLLMVMSLVTWESLETRVLNRCCAALGGDVGAICLTAAK